MREELITKMVGGNRLGRILVNKIVGNGEEMGIGVGGNDSLRFRGLL